jgi:glycine/D-amino acid oxidase-like deaminating enzyme
MIAQENKLVSRNGSYPANSGESSRSLLLPEERFQRMLWRETKRSKRSGRHSLLMLIDHRKGFEPAKNCRSLAQAAAALGAVIRDTDIAGWFDGNRILGVIFTEFGHADVSLAARAIQAKITHSLHRALPAQQLSRVHISFYTFPDSEALSGSLATDIAYQTVEQRTRGNDLLAACNSILHFRPTSTSSAQQVAACDSND